jgi:hypothetical protein
MANQDNQDHRDKEPQDNKDHKVFPDQLELQEQPVNLDRLALLVRQAPLGNLDHWDNRVLRETLDLLVVQEQLVCKAIKDRLDLPANLDHQEHPDKGEKLDHKDNQVP